MKLRWGILGTANIARKNWLAMRNSGNNIVTAVASRSEDRARAYIESNQAHAPMGAPVTAHGSYEALIADSNVDAVYVPLPTGLRKEWVIRAANAGKHVICEKPCGTSMAELREMLTACERNRVQFMDGVMMMHSARLPKIREAMDDGRSIGRLRRMYSSFNFYGDDDFRSGSFYCSFQTANQQFMTLSGTKGYLHMPDFVLPFFGNESGFDLTNSEFTVRGCDFNTEQRLRRVSVNEYSNSMPNAQEANLYRNFAEQVRSGRLNPEWSESVLKTQQVMEAVVAAAKGRK